MSVGRRARRERISAAFDAFHATMRDLLAAATRLSDAAARARRDHGRDVAAQEGLDAARADPGLQGVLANPRLAAAVDRVAADRDAAFDDWLRRRPDGSGPQRLDRHRRRRRPRAAGDGDGWLPRHGPSARARPDRCRSCGGSAPARSAGRRAAGTGSRSAVPLLDESHLQIDRARAGAPEAERAGGGRRPRRWSSRCCCGSSATSGPGWCSVHVWDVGQLTGSLPGLYPLTRTGLLTVHDPGDLEGLLDELSDRIRRVHTRVLVGGHPSLQALARADAGRAPSRGSSRCSSATGTPLGEEDRRQLQRVLRGGLACGISARARRRAA